MLTYKIIKITVKKSHIRTALRELFRGQRCNLFISEHCAMHVALRPFIKGVSFYVTQNEVMACLMDHRIATFTPGLPEELYSMKAPFKASYTFKLRVDEKTKLSGKRK